MTQLPLFPGSDTDVPHPSSTTLGIYAGHWIETVSAPPMVAPYTQANRRQMLRRYILPVFGEALIGSVTRRDAIEFQRSLFALGFKIRTVRNIVLSCLGPMLSEAYRDGLVGQVATRGLRWPREDPEWPESYNRRDRDRILRWFERYGPRYVPYVALIFLAGLRPSEAAGVQTGDVDFARGIVSIRRAVVNRKVGKTKTKKSVRDLYVTTRLLAILRAHRDPDARPGDFLVPSRRGGPLHTNGFTTYWWHRCLADLGIERRGPRAGRHHFATAAVRHASYQDVAEYMGNSPVILRRHYVGRSGVLRSPLRREKSKR